MEKFTFDGHGVNMTDKYATRIFTAAKHHADDGGGYVLKSDERRRVGKMFAASPEMADALLRAEAGAVMALMELDAAVEIEKEAEWLKEIRNYLVSVRDEARRALQAAGVEVKP